MTDGELYPIRLARRQHCVALGRTTRHGLFANNAPWRIARGRKYGHRGVQLLRRADTDQIRLLLSKHGFVIGVTPLDIKLITERIQRHRVDIANRDQISAIAFEISLRMTPANMATDNDSPQPFAAHGDVPSGTPLGAGCTGAVAAL